MSARRARRAHVAAPGIWAALLVIVGLALASVSGGGSGGETWGTVRRVNDGDTVTLTDGRLVRYLGIDAPEIDHRHATAEPFGYAARDENRKLVGDRRVRLVADREAHDHYGRLLAYLFLEDGRMVNRILLEQGLAHYLPQRNPLKRHAELLTAQRRAMTARAGLWSRFEEPATAYIGNRRSKRFHHPDCPYAKRISNRNRVLFQRSWDAFWEGYAPAAECLGSDAGSRGSK